MAAEGRTETADLSAVEPATGGGEPQPHLRALLERDPNSIGFFQAVRLLQILERDRRLVGYFGDPADEVVRFRANPSVAFPASEIQSLQIREDEPHEMTVNFMGLTGPQGVLPLYYSMLVQDRLRERDRTLKDFLDIFNHRIVSLFYRAWERSHFVVGFERERNDPISGHLLDLVGMGAKHSRGRMAVADEALIFYSGLLGPQQRSALALQRLIQDYFGVPVEIEQFVGGWYPLESETQCGLAGEEGDESSQLGLGSVVGDEFWDPQARVRIRLGPLSRGQYERFLPSGEAHQALKELTRFFSDDQFDFEVQLILAPDEVPPLILGSDDEAPVPLGWCTWIRSTPFTGSADQTTLRL